MSDAGSDTIEPQKPKRRSFLRDGLVVLSGQGAHVIFVFALGVLTLNIWGDTTLGKIRIALNMTSLAGVLGDLGMRKVLPYEIAKNEQDAKLIIKLALSLWLLSTVTLTVLCAIPYVIPGVFNTTGWWGVLAAVSIPGALLVHYTKGIALGTNRIAAFANLGWLNGGATLLIVAILGIALGLNGPDEGWARILAVVISSFIIGGYCVFVIRRETGLGFSVDFSRMLAMLRRGVLFALGGVLMRLNYRVDLIILGLAFYSIPAAAVGQYSIGASLAQFVWQIPITIGHLVIARGVRTKDPLEFARKNARLARLGTTVAVLAGIVFAIAAPTITHLLFRNIQGVNEIHIYIWILIPGVIAFIPARLFESDLIARNKPSPINYVMGPVVLANIALNLYLIPQNFYFSGAKGAALASTITYTLGTIGMTIVYARCTGLSVKEIVTPKLEDVAILIRSLRRRKGGA